jgi:hypothetical protein
MIQLSEFSKDYFKNDYDSNWVLGIEEKQKVTDKDLEEYIEKIIKENELRWNQKDFYSPSKKRRKIREEYKQS